MTKINSAIIRPIAIAFLSEKSSLIDYHSGYWAFVKERANQV
ncbi:hypothetical protein I656_00643 [Geobacillus sp. WSUCF1]|nr:hypothetical protein I656_00643 [Geobacillus sp. WSUCF1]